MKINQLIEELTSMRKRHGNIQVTCTGTTLPDDKDNFPNVFETTVENLVLQEGGENWNGTRRIRLYL